MNTFYLPRTGDTDLSFEGELLAHRSSRSPDKTTWQEIDVYRTESGRYISHLIGRSTIHPDVHTVTVSDTPDALVASLKRTSPRGDGRTDPYLTKIALATLTDAAVKAPEIADALVERV